MTRLQHMIRECFPGTVDGLRTVMDLFGLPLALLLAGCLYGPGAAGVFGLFAFPFLLLRHVAQQRLVLPPGPPATTSATARDRIIQRLDETYRANPDPGSSFGCLAIGIDGGPQFIAQFGHSRHARLLRQTASRIGDVLRCSDLLCQMEGGHFAVALAPVSRMSPDALDDLAQRIQWAVAEPLDVGGVQVRLLSAVGHCASGALPGTSGSALLAAAERALDATRTDGPGGIRCYSPEIACSIARRDQLVTSVASALEQGEIVAYFQPQVSTHTGDVTGFEALARWLHPTQGLLPPASFLPAIQAAGLSARLGQVMMVQALSALRSWDQAGVRVPKVSVNFSSEDLMDPRLADLIMWELDRFDLKPHRLTVEILETVVTDTPGDQIVRNIAALSRLGCGIDLDDFGTGHASISAMRRLAVNRIKIDRSLVTNVDSDPAQRRIVSAVLSMAAPLDLGVVAEGVEKPAEHAILAQLGCDHVQGYAIARPMPTADTLDWIRRHRRSLTPTGIPVRRAR